MPKFEPDDDKKYKVEAIQDSAVYAKEANGYPLDMYFFIAWNGYPEEENI